MSTPHDLHRAPPEAVPAAALLLAVLLALAPHLSGVALLSIEQPVPNLTNPMTEVSP